MHRRIIAIVAICLIAGTAALAEDNALGLYFSDSEFTRDTASTEISPEFAVTAYVVLTNATGSSVAGYEVGISCTAPGFNIAFTDLMFENAGTNDNHLVSYTVPRPVDPAGTVLSLIIFSADSDGYEEISFGPSDPPSLPDGVPVVDFGGGDLQPCSYPFDSWVVAWLNDDTVAVEARTLSEVKGLFE